MQLYSSPPLLFLLKIQLFFTLAKKRFSVQWYHSLPTYHLIPEAQKRWLEQANIIKHGWSSFGALFQHQFRHPSLV